MTHETSALGAMPEASATGDACDTHGRLPIRRRRQLFAALVTSTVLIAAMLMIWTLSIGGLGATDLALIALFTLTLPWTAIGFWNAVIGLVIMRTASDPARAVCPPLLDAADRISNHDADRVAELHPQ